MSFTTLGLDPSLLSTLTALGYTVPTQVQREAIPAAIAGGDLLVSSQTGSGKTAAFLLPALQRLYKPSALSGMGPRVLVLTPTRELALQVQKSCHGYGSGQRMRTASVVGGMPYGLQLKLLSRPVDIVIATPGRLKDHMDRRTVNLGRVELLVLDEADRMLDMGFQEEIDAIVAKIPKERQTLLFSATLEGIVGHLAQRVTRNPKRIAIARVAETKPDITQHALVADNHAHKVRMLDTLLREEEVDQTLVFTGTKRAAEDLSGELAGKGFDVGALHGDMRQRERSQMLQRLRDGKMKVLVATDVAARGIDVPGINLVVNYDAPRQAEDYVHRIGRTGRAGRAGVAVTFLGAQDRHLVRAIERFTGNTVSMMVIPGLEPKSSGGGGSRPRGRDASASRALPGPAGAANGREPSRRRGY
jgi:superfamily II DNA/RNA helicase